MKDKKSNTFGIILGLCIFLSMYIGSRLSNSSIASTNEHPKIMIECVWNGEKYECIVINIETKEEKPNETSKSMGNR